jgi:RecA-family ATPase
VAHHLDLRRLAVELDGEISRDQVLCPGPGHSRQDRSLSVKLDANAPDGFVVHSFAGDDPIVCRDHVRNRCGLPAFKPNGHRGSLSSEEIQRRIRATVMAQAQEQKPKGSHSATYRYVDANNALLYEVLRYDNPKTFRQRRPDGNGGWIWNVGERRVLYGLPGIRQYPDATTIVTEGEKDCDRLIGLGYCATTVASGKWTPDCVQALAGRDVWILEDNDEAGRKRARDAAEALYGTAKTIRIVQLPGLPDKGDVSDWLDSPSNNKDKLTDICFAAPLWTPEDGAAATQTPSRPTTPATSDPPPALAFINIAAWHGQPVPDRDWCVLNRIPMHNVTLFSGEGAIGKSIVSLQLAVAHVLGRYWLGTMPEVGPVLAVACEDDGNELHRRLSLILEHYGATFAELTDLHLLSLAGQDALLATPDSRGLIKPTKLFEQLRGATCDIRPKLVILDNSADVFGGNENDRAQVRQFIGFLRGLAISADAGVLLTSHPSLTGMNNNTGLSGSTAWNASVRSRLWMKRATTEKDEEPDPNLRVIEVMKANYGPVGEIIPVTWKDGVFVPAAAMGTFEKIAAERAADELFLKLLDRFADQGRNVSDKPAANNYAPKMFATDPDGKGRRKDLADAMSRLFSARKIRVEDYGRPSRPYTRLVRCG